MGGGLLRVGGWIDGAGEAGICGRLVSEEEWCVTGGVGREQRIVGIKGGNEYCMVRGVT